MLSDEPGLRNSRSQHFCNVARPRSFLLHACPILPLAQNAAESKGLLMLCKASKPRKPSRFGCRWESEGQSNAAANAPFSPFRQNAKLIAPALVGNTHEFTQCCVLDLEMQKRSKQPRFCMARGFLAAKSGAQDLFIWGKSRVELWIFAVDNSQQPY